MVELFCKNSEHLLAANVFCKEAPPQMLDCVTRKEKKKQIILYYFILLHILYDFINCPAFVSINASVPGVQ